MKVKRYKCINVILGSEQLDYEIPNITFGKSLVDKSGFVPIADAIKGLTAGNRAHIDNGNNYDFADGKDTGIDVKSRRPGRDIAEIFQDVHTVQTEFSASVKNGVERISRRSKANARHGVTPAVADSSTE